MAAFKRDTRGRKSGRQARSEQVRQVSEKLSGIALELIAAVVHHLWRTRD